MGLGNPGERYAQTRHNIGAMVVEHLTRREGAALKRHKSGCLVAQARLAGKSVLLARPLAFMNESGRPTRELLHWYKVDLERVVIVHDEIDIPFGDVRIKQGGGTAGHNGLRSIVSHVKSTDFVRIRVGVGRPRGSSGAADHVLAAFSSADRKELPSVIARAAEAVERIVDAGAERAMNEINTRS